MTTLQEQHVAAGATLAVYGPPEAGIEMVETFGPIELEYAAIRKGVGLLDQPSRAIIEATGADRVDFLSRMLTQELSGLKPGDVRRSFWLNKGGRIVADIRLIHLESRTLLDVDVHAAARTRETLDAFLFTEDCELHDRTSDLRRLALHGPSAEKLLSRFGVDPIADRRTGIGAVGNTEVTIARDDTAGVPGYELIVPAESLPAVYSELVEHGAAPEHDDESAPADHPGREIKLRKIGWHAYNVARIEAGTPMFHLDFGPDSLPHESGVLRDRVSFTKGCYLGQEIVARIESRGRPKQRLVALRCKSDAPKDDDGQPRQPIGGAQLFVPDDAGENVGGDVVGGITSSTLSPLLGAEPVCFAVVKDKLADAGTEMIVYADGEPMTMVVQEQLRFID